MLAPVDDPLIADFMAQLDRINALADEAPGFVWRLQTEEGNATDIHAYDDPLLLVNMSVWENIETLKGYTYGKQHAEILRKRLNWFEKLDKPHMVLWWVPAGHIPTTEEAKQRLDILEQLGPTPEGFTFKESFPPPSE